jgi:hypothetical protein
MTEQQDPRVFEVCRALASLMPTRHDTTRAAMVQAWLHANGTTIDMAALTTVLRAMEQQHLIHGYHMNDADGMRVTWLDSGLRARYRAG